VGDTSANVLARDVVVCGLDRRALLDEKRPDIRRKVLIGGGIDRAIVRGDRRELAALAFAEDDRGGPSLESQTRPRDPAVNRSLCGALVLGERSELFDRSLKRLDEPSALARVVMEEGLEVLGAHVGGRKRVALLAIDAGFDASR
jgi:hypothetical protein